MADDPDCPHERQERLDAMLEEFRWAQQRRFVKQGIALWNRTEAADILRLHLPLPEKRH